MTKQLEQVAEFHRTFGVDIEPLPTIPTFEICRLRHALLQEEVDELNAAAWNKDIVGVADGLTDCLYILFGTALAFGLQNHIEKIFDEVHRSNMSKTGPDGRPIYSGNGKVLKGPNYFKPDIESILK